MLQNLVCLKGPRQGSPPFLGCLQVRTRSRYPRPHVEEHRLQGAHSSQAPFTAHSTVRQSLSHATQLKTVNVCDLKYLGRRRCCCRVGSLLKGRYTERRSCRNGCETASLHRSSPNTHSRRTTCPAAPLLHREDDKRVWFSSALALLQAGAGFSVAIETHLSEGPGLP